MGCRTNLRACAKSRDQLCVIINKSKLLLVLFTLSTFVKHGLLSYVPLLMFFYFSNFQDIAEFTTPFVFRGSQKFYNFIYFYFNGLFTLPDADMDTDLVSDSKLNGYIVLCRTFHISCTRTQIPTPNFCVGQESYFESVPESVSGNVNEP